MNTMNFRSKPTKKSATGMASAHHVRVYKSARVATWTVIGYVASLFIPGINAYTAYPLALIKCGGKPVIASKFGGYTYMIPENRYYSVSFTNDPFLYYCSPQDAERAGFRPAVHGEQLHRRVI